jgi:hypothetical protein
MQGNLGSGNLAIGNEYLSSISLTQFYGIEIDDFAHEIAMLSLWLAEHQMNVVFKAEFGQAKPTLPLKEAGNIVCGNATRLDWEEVCPKEKGGEVYVLGNPPYLGFKMQRQNHKKDIAHVFKGIRGYKKLDYISCWLLNASEYIENKEGAFAFVSTNSICQGEHVGLLWPHIFCHNLEIKFAHTTFKWNNSAKGNAGVFCCIVGVGKVFNERKTLHTSEKEIYVDSINAYLSSGSNIIVHKRANPLSNLPKMTLGNMPKDDGNLILSDSEKESFLSDNPNHQQFIRKLVGAQEFLNGGQRWCIWISENNLSEALQCPLIERRTEKVKIFRLKSTDKSANKMAETPFRFREQHEASTASIIIPTVSSERRNYIPIGYLHKDEVIVAPNNAIYDPEPFVFGLLTSKMHMVWVETFAGRLKSDYRYSSVLCYNTFPFPPISEQRKDEITQCVFRILNERERYSERTLAQLYDPDKMPAGLREAHRENDRAVERCYRNRPFASDEDRLEYLFRLYEKMIAEEKEKNTLFEKPKKTRRKKAK